MTRAYRTGVVGKMQPHNRGATCLTSLGETIAIPSSVVTSLGLRVGHEIEFETHVGPSGLLLARKVKRIRTTT